MRKAGRIANFFSIPHAAPFIRGFFICEIFGEIDEKVNIF